MYNNKRQYILFITIALIKILISEAAWVYRFGRPKLLKNSNLISGAVDMLMISVLFAQVLDIMNERIMHTQCGAYSNET